MARRQSITSALLHSLPAPVFCAGWPSRLAKAGPWLLACACLLSSSHANAQLPGRAADFVRAGVSAAAAGKLRDARIDFSQAYRLAPGDPEVNFRLGLLYGQLGQEKEAAEAFRRAIRQKADFAEAHYNLALALIANPLHEVDWPDAISECRVALRLQPEYPEALHLLGVGLVATGDIEGAVNQFQTALRWNPNSAESRFDLGKALQSQGKSGAAETQFRMAIATQPVYPDAEIAWAKLLIESKRTAEAEAHLKNALKMNPDLATAHYLLGRALLLEGQRASARIEFGQASELTQRQTDDIQSNRLSNRGLDAARKADFTSAAELLHEAIRLKPDSALAHYNLGLILADQGNYAQAHAQIIEAISLSQAEPLFYRELARVAEREQNDQEAHAAMKRAIELDPDCKLTASDRRLLPDDKTQDPSSLASAFTFGAARDTANTHFVFGTLLGQRSDWLGAIGEWLRVLQLQPTHIGARNNLAVAYAKLGDLNHAELQFRRMLLVQPNSAAAYFGLAIVALQRNDNGGAIPELRQLIRIDPGYPRAQALLEQALAAQHHRAH